MADTFTKQERSRLMSSIRSKNTRPEIIVRSALHRIGFRFRLHQKNLPGTPDIVLAKYRALIFVHGCFWHQHEGCKSARLPKSNRGYWLPKLRRNVQRFKETKSQLKSMGWEVFVIWECETRSLNAIMLEELAQKIRGNDKWAINAKEASPLQTDR